MRPLFLFQVAALLGAPLPLLAAAPLPENVMTALRDGYAATEQPEIRRAASVLEAQYRKEPSRIELRRALGILFLDRLNEPAKALPHLQAAALAAPKDADWQMAYARALQATGRTEDAVRYFRKAAELKPRDFWPRYEAANALSGGSRYDEALQHYRDALDLAPKNAEVRLALAKTLWAAGDVAGAQRAAREILDLEPENAGARALLAAEPVPPPVPSAPPPPPPAPVKPALSPVEAAIAAAYIEKKPAQFAHAAELVERELAQHPGNVRLRQIAVDLYQTRLGVPQKAIPHLRVLAAAKPGLWLGVLAKAYVQAGDKAAAAETYAKVAAALPSDVWSRYELGKLQCALGQRAEAEASFRSALAIDPGNKYVRYEMVRCLQGAGQNRAAMAMARDLVRDEGDPLSRALLGDLYRSSHNLADAEDQYRAALRADPKDASATAGLEEIRHQRRPEAKFVFYTFDDTDHLRQTGLFTYASAFLNGRLSASVSGNERFFDTPGRETVERFEEGANLTYQLRTGVTLSAGVNNFKTENLIDRIGGNAALYVTPAACVDFSVRFRSADAVNDSYRAAETGLYQNVVSAGGNFRPSRYVQASVEASSGEYSDGNTRRFGLASLAWFVPIKTAPVLRVEYQGLDFDHHTSDYSSPQNYALFRPVLEFTPALTSWLSLEFHGELPYVLDEQQWGNGLTVGPRVRRGDWLSAGFSYLHYEIPGGQTTWSGNGFKFDLSVRF